MIRRTLVLVVILTASMCSPAMAGWRIDRAEQIAAIVWHHPCGNTVPILWRPTPADVTEFTAAWVFPGQCELYMSTTDPPRAWQDVCDEVLHEYGHLAGYHDPANTADPDHSLNERSVMYGGLVREDDPRCAQRGRPFLALHPSG